jgi:hypothetical protein
MSARPRAAPRARVRLPRGPTRWTAATLAATLGCGAGVPKPYHGEVFVLSGREAKMAAEDERAEPRAAGAQERCDYWTAQKEDAAKSHLLGVFKYTPEYFEHLHAWAEAHETAACAQAKAEADAVAAEATEAERLRALAEARVSHDAGDRRAWDAARLSDCDARSPGFGESSCDGLRAYLRTVPDGEHVADATAALEAAAPKLAELRRLREAAEAARVAAASRQEEAAGFRVSSLRAALDDAALADHPGHSLRLGFDVTLLRALPRGVTPLVRAACLVGDKRMVDVDTPQGARLNELLPGDTRALDANPYGKSPLTETPSRCEIVVMKGAGVETTGARVHAFCWVPGGAVEEGECAPR